MRRTPRRSAKWSRRFPSPPTPNAASERGPQSGRKRKPTRAFRRPAKILLEGRPGSGKTTVAERLAELLRQEGLRVGGFTTQELREHGRRVGFAVEAFGGERATLAHISLPGPPRVSRYGVDLNAFERVALPALEAAQRADAVVIDELGKMELASDPFADAVAELFDRPLPLVATIHVFRHPFTDALKGREDVERVQVMQKTRDALPRELAARLQN